MEWMLMPLRRYAEFSGRSRRKEYWMFFLFVLIVGLVLRLLESAVGMGGGVQGTGILSGLFSLATLVPSIAVGVRRLHDTDRTGWWLLVPIIPYIAGIAMLFTGSLGISGILMFVGLAGAIVLLVFFVMDGTRGPNRYGPDPKGAVNEDVFA
jgi:uncharacterized membrane protein YhaH (DUF805 family)